MLDIANIEHEAIVKFANRAARIGLAEALAQQVTQHSKLTEQREIATNPATKPERFNTRPAPFAVQEMRVLP